MNAVHIIFHPYSVGVLAHAGMSPKPAERGLIFDGLYVQRYILYTATVEVGGWQAPLEGHCCTHPAYAL